MYKVNENFLHVINVGQVILKEPLSLLIPTNETGEISCRARCERYQCNSFWIINNSLQINGVNKPGMWSTLNWSVNGDEYTYTLTLTLRASEVMNNTTIQCEFEATGHRTEYNQSAIVNLFVISREWKQLRPNIISGLLKG